MIIDNFAGKNNAVRVYENRPEIKKMLSVFRNKENATQEDIDESWLVLENACHSMFFGKFAKNFTLHDASCDYEDFAHDILLKVYEKLEKYDESRSSFGTWLYNLCKGEVSNYLRKSHMPCFADLLNDDDIDEDDILNSVSDGISAEDKYMEKYNEEVLMNLIKKLPPQYKEAYCLCRVNGFGVSEVAEKLGCTDNVISLRLNRGQKRLREDSKEVLSRDDYVA